MKKYKTKDGREYQNFIEKNSFNLNTTEPTILENN